MVRNGVLMPDTPENNPEDYGGLNLQETDILKKKI